MSAGTASKMDAGREQTISCVVNGQRYEVSVPVRRLLTDFLRHDLGLTGTHVGCEHGVCGACTVMVDGDMARGCLMLAVQADGAEITTIEGLTPDDGTLHPVQEALSETHGLQCGFCTPGFVVRVVNLLDENPNPTREEIVEEISGNICRCTGYQGIIAGVELAVQKIAGKS